MIFCGWQKESFNEWPGKISSVVFVSGCNFRCPFCHNAGLIFRPDNFPQIKEKEVIDYCRKNKDFLDALALTGGEPLLRPISEIKDFVQKIKSLGLLVAIETNGSQPKIISALMRTRLVDYWAMDIKAPLEEDKYYFSTGVKIDLNDIKKSIKIIMDSAQDYEFRTTVVPSLLKKEDLMKIGKEIKGARCYYLQQFRNQNTLDQSWREIKPYDLEWFKDVQSKIKGPQKIKIRI
ncbi:anaerobic ribonucleoside-triphosphate reductase activating protein [Patescibacteria group bacterium]|nr:anaerobic ribonucleoside-triphosphate reductase activating protein [Patescibacteria group bacterium]